MLIDWFTVAAQVVNFLILVWLLKRFLYGPILRAMDAREAKIAGRLGEAARKQAEAEEEAEAYRRRNRDLDARREEMLLRAGEEAEEKRKKLLAEARREAERALAGWREALERETGAFFRELRGRLAEEVFAVSRRVLGDLADAGLEARLADLFAARLGALEEKEKAELAAALGDGGEVVVNSVFEMPPAGREKLAGALRELLGREIEPRFRTAPDLLLGIELSVPGRKVGWSAAGYIDEAEERVARALEEKTAEAPKDGNVQ